LIENFDKLYPAIRMVSVGMSTAQGFRQEVCLGIREDLSDPLAERLL